MIDSPNLLAALSHNGLDSWLSKIESVYLEITGENDGYPWHWIVKLADKEWAYATGECDYTGWDCHSSAEIHRAKTLKAALALAPQDERRAFEEMLKTRRRKRAASSLQK